MRSQPISVHVFVYVRFNSHGNFWCAVINHEKGVITAGMSSSSSESDGREGPAPVRSRKRLRDTSKWKLNVAIQRKNLGKDYVSRHSGRRMEGASIGPPCSDECFRKVTMPVIKQLFQEFWDLGNYGKQSAYIQKIVHVLPVKRNRKTKTPDAPGVKRDTTLHYTVVYKNTVFSVCRAGFLAIFGLKRRRVENAVKRVTASGTPIADKRGWHKTHKVTDRQVDLVCEHIVSIPAVSSHYTRV